MAEDNFERMWPDADGGRTNEDRAMLITDMTEMSTEVHAMLVERGVSKDLMPTALGILVGMTLAVQEKLENNSLEIPMLTLPAVPGRVALACEAALAMVATANEGVGCA